MAQQDDNIKRLYEELKNEYDVGSEQDFRNYLDKPENRKALYGELRNEYEINSEKDFDDYLGFGETTQAGIAAQQVVDEYDRSVAEYGGSQQPQKTATQNVVTQNDNDVKQQEVKPTSQPRAQFVPEYSNVKGFTVANDSPLRQQYPFLAQLGEDEQAYFRTDTNEPLYAWKDSEGKDITPDEAATLNQRADIEQNDAIRPRQVPVTSLQLPEEVKSSGIRTDKKMTEYIDGWLKEQYGDDYLDRQITLNDGTTVSGDEMLGKVSQQVYDNLNKQINEARVTYVSADSAGRERIINQFVNNYKGLLSEATVKRALEEHDALQEATAESKRRERAEWAQMKEDNPGFWQTLKNSIGAGFVNFGAGLLDTMQELSSGLIVEDPSKPGGYMRTRSYEESLADKNDPLTIATNMLHGKAERLSKSAQPYKGKKGFLDMLWDGEITEFLQKGVATAGESLPMTLSAFNPYTMAINAISMAGSNFRQNTLDNPNIPAWKRAMQAIGSAAIEQAVEKYSDPIFKYVGGNKVLRGVSKENSEKIVTDVTEEAVNTLSGRIFNRMKGLTKDAAGEGVEEVMTDAGNDLLGETLDLVSGSTDYGLRAQWEEFKEDNPNADLKTFAKNKAKEYVEDFIGGAMAGAYTSSTTQLSAKALQYSFDKIGAAQNQVDPTRLNPVQVDIAQSYDDGYNAESGEVAEMTDNYNRQRMKVESTFSLETVTEIDNDPISLLDSGSIKGEDMQTVIDYVNAKARYDGIMQRNSDDAETGVDHRNLHSDGMIHAAVLYPSAESGGQPQEVFIIKGDIVADANGKVDVEKSSDMITYRGVDGLPHIASPDKFQSVAQPISVEEYVEANAPQESVAQTGNAQTIYNPGDEVVLKDENGNAVRGEVMYDANADGQYQVRTESPINGANVNLFTGEELDNLKYEQPSQQENVTDEYSRFVDSGIVSDDTVARIADKIANGQQLTPEEESMRQGAVERVENLLKEKQNGQNRQTAQAEQASQPQQIEASGQEQTALSRIPVDEKGKPAYDKAEPDLAWDAIMEKTDGDEEMAKNVVDAMVKQQEAEVDKLKKKQPKAIPGDVDSMIAAQKEKKAAIAAAEERLEQWKKIADTPNRRAAAANVQPTQNPSDETSTQPAAAIAPTENTGNVEPTDTGNAQTTEQGAEVPTGVQGTVEDRAVSEETSAGNERELDFKERLTRRRNLILQNLGDKYSLSDEEADNGELFYQNGNGSTTLAVIPDEIFDKLGLAPVPFKLTESMGWHVFDHHAKELKLKNISDAIDFVLSIINNVDTVRLGRDNSYIFSIENGRKKVGHRAVAIIVDSRTGEFMGIRTAGYESLKNIKERPLLWTRGTLAVSEDVATSPISTVEPQQDDEDTGRTKEQSNSPSSGSKDTQTSANEQTVGEKIAQEEAKVEQNPTEAQKEAGNYKKGHVKIDGYDVTIENPKGSVRSGVDRNGQEWSVTMNNTYGYIRGTEGVDGDHIDVFLSDDPTQGDVYVIDQVNEDGSFDEHKVMYGFKSALAAKRAYLANYSPGWKGLGIITKVSKEEFKKWINSSHRKTKPFAEYKSVNKDGAQNEGNTLANEAHELFSGIIAQSTHNIEINDSGVSETDNTLYAPIKVDGKYTNLSLFQEEPAHSSGEPIVGVSFYRDGMTYQEAADLSDAYNQYVGEKVCTDGSDELAINFGSIDEAVRFEEWLNDNGGVRFREAEDDSTHKQRQLEIINDTNPMLDDYHTGIRSEDDIKTMREAIEEARSEAEKYGDETWSAYPDITNEMLDEALRSGKITVYSSKPIVNGNFVTPSRMQASDYAGGGRIYSKTVNIDDVAWINTDEGQYANTDNEASGNIRFRFIGEQGAARLDAAEEATTRLDNLSTARRMEQAYNDKKARIDKLRDSKSVEITGEEIEPSDDLKQYKKNALEYGKKLRGEYTNKDTGETITLSSGNKNGGLKEVLQHDINDPAHLQSVAAIPGIIENSIYIASVGNEDVEKNPNVARYHYYVCGLNIGDTDYTVKAVVAEQNNGNRYYDHKLTEIEKGKLIEEIAQLNQTSPSGLSSTGELGETEQSRPAASRGETQNSPVSKFKDKRLISLLQTNDQENARKIKLATGWERGADGKWRYETPDFEYHPNGDARQNDKYKESDWYKELYDLEERLFNGETLTDEETRRFDELAARENEIRDNEKNTERIYLDDYVKDDELFNAYPELKQTRVDFVDLPNEEYSAKYNSEENRITVNQAKSIDIKSVLAHEIQHAIQRIEGFASGSNTDNYRNAATSENVIADINAATGGRLVESGGFNNTPEGIFDALNRKTTYGTILRDNSTELDEVARKYGYETIFDLVNDIGKFKSSVEMYRSEAGEVEARNVQERLNMTPEQRRNTLAEETEDVAREDQQFLQDAIGTGESLVSTVQSDDIDTAVADTANKLNIGVRVAHSVDEVNDEGVRRAIEKGRNVKGWYDTRTGEIVVYAPNATDADDAVRTVLHEGVAHYGLRQLVGDENFDTFLDNIYNNVDEEIKAAIDEKAQRHGWSTRVATEEYLASLAEDTNFEEAKSSGLWQKIKDFFMDLLTKAGVRLNEALTDNELRYILWRSYENLQEPNGRDTIGTVRDVAMQGRLGVGNYGNADVRLRETNNAQAQESQGAAQENDEGTTPTSAYIVDAWDKQVKSDRFKLVETGIDYLNAVDKFQKLIAKHSGKEIKSFENAYDAMTFLSSKNREEMDMFESFFVTPLNKAIQKLIGEKGGLKKWDWSKGPLRELVMYVEAKHGTERNRQMAVEAVAKADEKNSEAILKDWAAAKKRINEQEGTSWQKKQRLLDEAASSLGADLSKDYSGLSSVFGDKNVYPKGWQEESLEYVSNYENGHEAKDINGLWTAIGNATGFALQKQYETGLVSREYVESQKERFDNYIPLRGFEDEIAGDVYSYLGHDFYPGSNPVKTAHGRTSEPGNPFGSILNTAYASISSGNKNVAKTALYSLVVNHDTGGLAVAKRAWMVKYADLKNNPELESVAVSPKIEGDEEIPEWVEAIPRIPKGDKEKNIEPTAQEISKVLADFEAAMKKYQKEDITKPVGRKAKIAYKTLHNERDEHEIPLFIAGDKYVITITGNPRVAQAMNGLLNPDSGEESAWREYAKKMQRFMSGAFTAKNAAFSFANLAKDTIYANNQAFIRENPKYWLRFTENQRLGFGDFIPMMRRLKRYRNGKLDLTKKRDRMFKEFMENGGATGYTFVNTQEEYAKELAKKLDELSKKTPKALSLKGLWNIFFDTVEFMGQAAELVNRFAAYKTSREMGRTVNRSIRDAKEITVNFNRKGAGRKTADKNNKWYINLAAATSQYGRNYILFWNANMQAKYRFFKNIQEHPIKTSVTLIANSMAIGGAVIPFINNLALPALYEMFGIGGDDDDDDYYNALTDWERTHNICLRLPRGYWLKIPLSPEMTPWYSMGDAIGGAASGQRDLSAKDFIESTIDAVSPLSINWSYSGGAFLTNFLPTVIQPIAQNMMNVNFMGNPIKKTTFSRRQGKSPEYTMVYRSASPTLVELSRLSNRILGGEDDKTAGEWRDWNPAMVQNLISGYAGGYGTTILSIADWIVNTSKGEKQAVAFSKIPFVSRFVISGNKDVKRQRINSRYNDVKEFVTDFEFDMGRYEKRVEEAQKKADPVKLSESMSEYDKLLSSERAEKYMELYELDRSIKYYEDYLDEFTDDEVTQNLLYNLKQTAIETLKGEKEEKEKGKQ